MSQSLKALPVLHVNQSDTGVADLPSYCVDDVADVPYSLESIAKNIAKAKRVAVVCGAGISCASGIPDFRSSEGLFNSLKKQHPEARLSSGKDLFDASHQFTPPFYTMIAQLKKMADDAQPTDFHAFLKSLNDQGKLFRVYTQNIDGLEQKAGLSYGLGDPSIPIKRRKSVLSPEEEQKKKDNGLDDYGIPKCIPLHGHLATLSCPYCSHSVSTDTVIEQLHSGEPVTCPECVAIENVRQTVGDRSRGVGTLKPDVVLYGESHREGERVGAITQKDLMGARPDLLIVAGTSLKVPGTKLLVRELAKVIRPPPTVSDDDDEMPSSSALSSSSGSGGGSGIGRIPKAFTVYLNHDFPAKEWKDVFDVWVKGDIQEFTKFVDHVQKSLPPRRAPSVKARAGPKAKSPLSTPTKKAKVRTTPQLTKPVVLIDSMKHAMFNPVKHEAQEIKPIIRKHARAKEPSATTVPTRKSRRINMFQFTSTKPSLTQGKASKAK